MKIFLNKKEKSLNKEFSNLAKNILGTILIIAGITAVLYPSISNFYYDKKQEAIIKEHFKTMSLINIIDDDTYNIIEDENEHINNINIEEDEKVLQLKEKWPVETILHIEKIDLLMPVIKGATKEHLNISLASIDNTGKPWYGNNYSIAGHKSRKYGRHFNRLYELEIDDNVTIFDNDNNKYNYKVFSKEVVDGTEISVLENRDISELTLITCYPPNVKNPPTRLVIKAIEVN